MARRIVGAVGLIIACSPADADETSGVSSTSTAATASTSASTSTSGANTGSSSAEGVPTTGAPATSTGAGSTSTGDAASSSEASGEPGESTETGAESTTGAPPLLRVEPAQAQVVVASGWSFPAQFTAVLSDGDDTPVVAAWTVDDAALGRITRYGGTFAARNTAGGTVQVSAEFAGQIATADVEVVIVDDHPVCPPRPPLTDGVPTPGQYIKVVAPEYEGTGVYHGVYLPPDWTPERRYPVIVESPCNTYGQFTGKVDDTRMGYHWAGCRDYVWIVMPYILNDANLNSGWGDTPATLEYWRTNVPRTLAAVGGDPGAVVVTGFSRGALGAGWIGLQDDGIADAWAGFYLHSHADAPGNGITPDGGANSPTRMMRVAGRSSLVSWGAAGDGGMTNSVKGADLLTMLGSPVETFAVPGVGHTEVWMIDDAVSREHVQDWLFATIAARPGTGAVYGRVTDLQGDGVAGVRVEAGPLHWDVSDAAGYYGLRGLSKGMRAVACTAPGCGAPIMVDVGDMDVEDADFVAP